MNDKGPAAGEPEAFDQRYVIQRELARGGMGRVFLAHDRRIGRDVALKVLSTSSHDEDALRRFTQEARAAGSLNHPNVVTVLDAGTHLGQPYIVSELLTGQTLRERLSAGALPLKTAVDLALQLARGLSAAHDKGIVHRDLKPENLFIDREGWLKILDFGIAKLLDAGPPPLPPLRTGDTPVTAADNADLGPHTSSGRIVGTVGYMAPEQVRGEPVDHRADLFSFGTVLYEMLGGARAFQSKTPLETHYSILSVEPKALPRTVPAPLRALVARCLEKKREARPQSARELVTALEAVHPEEAPRRRRLRLAAAALLLLAAAGAVFLWLRKDQVSASTSSVPTVAVLPFTVRGNERFAYLGEGMVDLLSTNLAGGAVHVVDAQALVRQASRSPGPLDLKAAREVAARVSAARLVLGSVVEAGGKLHLRATLYEVRGSDAPLAEARAEGEAGDLFRLVDDLTLQLRRKLAPGALEPEGPGGRLARLATRMTRSPEALEAYLEGESTLRRGSWRNALVSFGRAVKLDPEFALAQYRLAVAASIREPATADAALARALAAKDRLSQRDRALMEAYVAFREGHITEAEQQYRQILAAHPEEVEAWYQLGELLFHFSPLLGKPVARAAEPFGRALILDPLHGAALIHTIDLAQLDGQLPLVLALVDRYLANSDAEPGTRMPEQWTRAWARGDDGARASLLDELRSPSAARLDLYRTLIRSLWQNDNLADAQRLAEVFAAHPALPLRAEGTELLGLLDLARGRPRAGREKLLRAAAMNPESAYAAEALLAGALDHFPATRAQLEADLAAVRTLPAAQLKPGQQLHLEGLLALRLDDLPAVARVTSELEKLQAPGSIGGDLALSLRARLALRAGQPREALALLEKQKLVVPYQIWAAYARMLEPLLRAELHAGLGQPAQAAPLCALRSYYSKLEPIWFAPAELCAARAAEEQGQRRQAAAHYGAAIALWADCEPELRPAVDEARRRLLALGTK